MVWAGTPRLPVAAAARAGGPLATLWVPHTVRLSNTTGGARILGFPPHAGRGDVHDPDEPPYRLITVGVDEVTNLVLIWNDGSRALHAPRVQ